MSILIVEDNEMSVKILEKNLQKLKYQTIVSHNGKEALESLRIMPEIQLVITDINMPEMGGLEFLAMMKKTPEWKDIPVIICTVTAEAETVKKAVSMGCKHSLLKPIDPNILKQRVAEALKSDKPILDDENKVTAQFGLDHASYKEIVRAFRDLLGEKIALLEQQIENKTPPLSPGDLQEFSQSASILGAKRVVDILDRLTQKSEELEPEALISEYGLLLREMKKLQQALPFKPPAAVSSPDSEKSSPLFSMNDFQEPGKLAKKLKVSQDAFSQYILEQFSPDAKQLLNDYDESGSPSENLKQAMVDELNQLLKGDCIYEEKRFEGISLTEAIRKLIEKNLQGEELVRLNRLLLEEACPEEIAKGDNKPSSEKKS